MMRIDHHNCTGVRVVAAFPENSNSITLRIESETGGFDVTLYGLPMETTGRIVEALGPPEKVFSMEKERSPVDVVRIETGRGHEVFGGA